MFCCRMLNCCVVVFDGFDVFVFLDCGYYGMFL